MRMRWLILMWGFHPFAHSAVDPNAVCPDLVVREAPSLAFTDSEKRLLCGDPQVKGWQKIPKSQAIFSLKNFLQDRGYYYPKFETQGEQTIVTPGEPTKVAQVELHGAPPELEGWNSREHRGEIMTPAVVKAVGVEVSSRLGRFGYGCPTVEPEANAQTGVIGVKIKSGQSQDLVDITEEPIEGLAPGVLRRYDALRLGAKYDSELLPLTAARIITDGVVRNVYFNISCTPGGIVAEQKALPGKPREVNLGAGLNTDRGIIARGSWKHARLGPMGSQFSAALTASYRGRDFNTQEGTAEAEYYFLNYPSRVHLRPSLTFRHWSDNRKDVLTGQLQALFATTWDRQTVGGLLSIGPSMNGERNFRGPGIEKVAFLTLAVEAKMTSHAFEWRRSDPSQGYEFASKMAFTRKGWFSDFTAQMLTLRYTHLASFPEEGRRKFILGWRGGFATTVLQGSEGGLAALTPSLRHYLGGTANLRGYGIQELPDEFGGLTSLFGAVEGRGAGILPFDVQPFAFTDIGSISRNSLDFGGPWYLSVGAGLRLPTPVGVFRLSVARGYPMMAPSTNRNLQFHFTYGEEF